MWGWLPLAVFIVILGGSRGALGQNIENCVIKGDITNNQAPVTINFPGCQIVLPPKLGAAEVRFIAPKLVDLRTITDPDSAPQDEWMGAPPVLSVEPMAYEHVSEPAVRAQVHVEEAYLAIGPKTYRFRAFQWVDIGTTGVGWLGRKGDALPFSIGPGAVKSHTTQFKAADSITWAELVALLESQPMMKVAILAKVSQSNANPDDAITIIQAECAASLTTTQQQIAQLRQQKGRPPKYVQILCEGN